MRNNGAWSYIIEDDPHLIPLCKSLGINPAGKAIKRFKERLTTPLNEYRWGGDWGFPIIDCTKVQNIAWSMGYAPRVHALGEHDGEVFQIVDYVQGDVGGGDIELVLSELEKAGVILHNDLKDYGDHNFINGKLVDFQIFGIDDDKHRQYLLEKLKNNVWGFSYQSVPELYFTAHRDINTRVKDFGLNKINFKGKTVLDIGCSNGMFCNYAISRGAKRVVGLDFPVLTEVAFLVSNYLGNFGIDYYGVDLLKEDYQSLVDKIGIDKFDYVFFFSMCVHVGSPIFIKDFTKGTLITEKSGGNIGEKNEEEFSKLLSCFHTTRLKNSSDENREAYRCKI